MASARLVSADDELDSVPGVTDEEPRPRLLIALGESAAFLGLLDIGYENDLANESIDFDLEWDWESWQRKLTFDAVRFDTNNFHVNAFRHPLMSAIQYHIGRSNNLGMPNSSAV